MRALLGILLTLIGQQPPSPRPLAVLGVWGTFNLPTLYYAPAIVVYGNGLVIYQTATEPVKQFRSVILSPDEIRTLIPPADVAALVNGDTVPRGDTSRVGSDVQVLVLDLWRDTIHQRVTLRGDTSIGSASFAHIVSRLSHFSSVGAKSWVPDSIEINLRPIARECNPTKPVAWPESLPHPGQLPDTLVHFFVAAKYLSAVSDLLNKHGNWDCTPVLLGGRWWGLSYDFPYPAQSLWLRK
jgi:hypothetical protein